MRSMLVPTMFTSFLQDCTLSNRPWRPQYLFLPLHLLARRRPSGPGYRSSPPFQSFHLSNPCDLSSTPPAPPTQDNSIQNFPLHPSAQPKFFSLNKRACLQSCAASNFDTTRFAATGDHTKLNTAARDSGLTVPGAIFKTSTSMAGDIVSIAGVETERDERKLPGHGTDEMGMDDANTGWEREKTKFVLSIPGSRRLMRPRCARSKG